MHMYTIPIRSVFIICHCVELSRGSVVLDMWSLLYRTAFLVLKSNWKSASSCSLKVLRQQYVKTYLIDICCWWVITGNVILVKFFYCTFCIPVEIYLLHVKQTRAHKPHRISSSVGSHDNILLYLYWYILFVLLWLATMYTYELHYIYTHVYNHINFSTLRPT